MSLNNPTLAFIGAGRVGSAFSQSLQKRGYMVTTVYSRSRESAQILAQKLGCVVAGSPSEAAFNAQLTFLTVPDDVIETVCKEVAQVGDLTGRAIVHTSGVSDMSVLESARDRGAWVGGLHPMLAIMDRDMLFSDPSTTGTPDVTFGVEAASEPLSLWLADMVNALNGIALWLRPGTDRARYHAAGVIASNYMVTLFAEATGLLQSLQSGGDDSTSGWSLRQVIVQLLEKTLANIKSVGAVQALTGPVVRGDAGTVEKHLTALWQTDPELAEIYRLLAKRTLRIAAERGLSQEKLHGIKSVLRELNDADIHTQYSEDEA